MSKIIKAKTGRIENLYNGEHKDIDIFESAVDFFTLLSFVFIVAAFLFGIQQLQHSQTETKAKIIFKEVGKGGSISYDIPENTLIIILTKKNNNDVVYFVKGGELTKTIYRSGQSQPLMESLDNEVNSFKNAEDIHIVVDNEKHLVNSNILLDLQNWLAHHSFTATINFQRKLNGK